MDFDLDSFDLELLGTDSLNFDDSIEEFYNGGFNSSGSSTLTRSPRRDKLVTGCDLARDSGIGNILSETFSGKLSDPDPFHFRRGGTIGSGPNRQTITQPGCIALREPRVDLGDDLNLDSIPSNNWQSGVFHTNDPTIQSRDIRVVPQPEPLASADTIENRETLHRRGKRRTVFSNNAKRLLNDAFAVHPYPLESVKETLAMQCGVHVKSINTWFVNKRGRSKPLGYSQVPEQTIDITAGSEPAFHQDHTPLTEPRLEEMLRQLDHIDNQLPIERYLHTPLEEERVDMSRIQLPSLAEESDESRHTSLFSHSTSGLASVSSVCFAGSVESVNSRGSKKGRKQHWNTFKTVARTKDGFFRRLLKTKERLFYCTFCGQCFRHQYEWKRHEESLHVPRRVWICVVPECPLEAFEQRMFFRKDNFFAHVRRCHDFPKDANEPKSSLYVEQFGVSLAPIPPDHAVLKCGFCGHISETWQSRTTHVAKHFNKGNDLTSWWLRRLDCMYSLQPKYQSHSDRFGTHEGNGSEAWCNSSGGGFSGYLVDCKDCGKSFPSLTDAVSQHSDCNFWSCRYLLNAGRAFDDLNFCVYCGIFFSERQTEQLQHLLTEHDFRGCDQELFHDFQDFQGHMVEHHSSSGLESYIHSQPFSSFHFSITPQIQ